MHPDPHLSGELESVSAGGVAVTYRRTAATGWHAGVTYTVGSSTRLSSTRTADARGRLDAVTWSAGGATVSGHDYSINAMNRRTAAQRQDGSHWDYGYNNRGEVTSAAKEDALGIPEPGKQYGFAFDGIGNRTSSTVSSLANNETLRSTGYTANALNQYDEITHPQPGWLVLRGSVNTAANISVTIDNEPPTVRAGPLWHYEKSVDNSAGAVRRVAEITASRSTGGLNNGPVTTKQKGSVFIPPHTEVPTYDLDGNQTADARWNYAWDGENRLILAEEKPIPTAVAAGVSTPSKRTRLEFSYDAQNRRLTKRVLTAAGSSGTFILKQSLVCLYDGWNMIAEIDTTTTPRLLRSYEWGLDLSGTMDGAGGVGGLLIERFHSATTSTTVNNSQPPPTGAHAPCFDGNGNITELVNLANGSVSARYEYGAFGETISVDGGAVAEANPFRFSTKYLDAETGFYNYTHRYYDAVNGRWLCKDPIEELGGANLYAMVWNDPVNRWDMLGQMSPSDPNNPATWHTSNPGVWLDGVPGQGRFMPALGSGHADLGLINYKNGVPLLSQHPGAIIDGRVHIIVLEEWKGTSWDTDQAWKQLADDIKAKLPTGDYVWHHEEIVEVNGRKGVRLVLVPRALNSIPHSGPASWKRAADRLAKATAAVLPKVNLGGLGGVVSGAGKCLVVAAKVSFILDPVGAITGPPTTFADATVSGQIEACVNNLQQIRDIPRYWQQLLELKRMYQGSEHLKHLVPLIDKQLQILNNWNSKLPVGQQNYSAPDPLL